MISPPSTPAGSAPDRLHIESSKPTHVSAPRSTGSATDSGSGIGTTNTAHQGGGTEMPETTAFTSCSCSHSRPAPSSAPLGTPRQSNGNEYASALAGTIKAAQVVHARMEQCREWANVVAVAARDAEHADPVPGTGASNPFMVSHHPSSTPRSVGPGATGTGKALNGHRPASAASARGTAQGSHGPAGGAHGHAHRYVGESKPQLPRLLDMHLNLNQEGDSDSDDHDVAQAPTVEVEVYPPTAPAKWYDDPVADARSRPGSAAASRSTTPTKIDSVAQSTTTISTNTATTAPTSCTSPETSCLGANMRLSSGLSPMHAKRPASEGDGHDIEPAPKRRSAPTSPVRPFLLSLPVDRDRPAPRPLLTGTIASRTGPALAQVRAAFASVGVECPSRPGH